MKHKLPEELTKKRKTEPLSTRIDVEAKKTLQKAAKRAKSSISDLAAGILENYAEWYESQNLEKEK